MTTAWTTQHRRSTVIREVLTRLERTRDGRLPWQEVPGTVEVFGEPGALLRALQLTWFTRLTAALDLAMEAGDSDLVEEVQMAWYDLAWRTPGLRRVLDAHQQDPAVAPGRVQEHRALAVSAGLATLDEPAAIAAACGRQLVSGGQAAAPAPACAWGTSVPALRTG
ncbi:MAG TPA: hypothetical protein VFR22_01680 [Nocardioidaceae bacterium]|nr:hypothetical protein [Nocardioidaceae bacterium]